MLFVYQLKVGLCLAVFYLLLKLLLGRETLHRAYRLSLLLAAGLSLVVPLVHVAAGGGWEAQGMAEVGAVSAQVEPAPVAGGRPSAGLGLAARLAYIIYIIGVGASLLWQLVSLWRLGRLLGQGRAERRPDGTWLHVLDRDLAPFSFLRHIVIGRQDYDRHPREILTHEQAHIRLHHSADVLLMNLLTVVQWWNPAAWLLRRELQQVHEYEADKAVLERGVDARQYQLLLIRKSVGNQLFSMANNLNHQSLKKRIRMMTRRKSSPWKTVRLVALLPASALVVAAFASPNVENVASLVGQAVAPGRADTATVAHALPVVAVGTPAVAARDTAQVYEVVEVMPEFEGGIAELMQYLMRSMKYPKDAQDQGREGRVIVSFVVDRDGSVVEPRVVQGVFPSLDEEALRVVRAMPRWTPGRQKGQAVRVKYTLPITFKLQGDTKKQAARK